jgi:hypothetical protein
VQGFYKNMQRHRGGLVFKAHSLLYRSALGLRVINKKKKLHFGGVSDRGRGPSVCLHTYTYTLQ